MNWRFFFSAYPITTKQLKKDNLISCTPEPFYFPTEDIQPTLKIMSHVHRLYNVFLSDYKFCQTLEGGRDSHKETLGKDTGYQCLTCICWQAFKTMNSSPFFKKHNYLYYFKSGEILFADIALIYTDFACSKWIAGFHQPNHKS